MDGVEIQRGDGFADGALDGIRQVGTNLRGGLHHRHPFFEEVCGSLIFRPSLGGLFSHHVCGVIQVFGFDSLAIHEAAKLLQEDVGRAAVEHQMMHIHQQIGLLFGSHYFKTIERTRAEVERLREVLFILRQFFLTHLFHGNLYHLLQINGLYDTLIAIAEVDSHLRMRLDECLDSLGKCCCIGILLELNAIWNIVQRRGGILQAVEIDAGLGVGERDAL